jgi:hypothetical protein
MILIVKFNILYIPDGFGFISRTLPQMSLPPLYLQANYRHEHMLALIRANRKYHGVTEYGRTMISFLVPISSKEELFQICTRNLTVAHNILQQNLSQVISQGFVHFVSCHTYGSEGYRLRIQQQQIRKLYS